MCGVAIGVLGYCSYRAIAHNPDVHVRLRALLPCFGAVAAHTCPACCLRMRLGRPPLLGAPPRPPLQLTKAHKQDGAAESGITLERAQLYYHSIFRKAKAMRTDGVRAGGRGLLGGRPGAGCERREACGWRRAGASSSAPSWVAARLQPRVG